MTIPGALAKKFAYRASIACGAHVVFRALNRGDGLVLAYHGVHDGELPSLLNLDGLYVQAQELERQLEYLARYWDVVPLDQLSGRSSRQRAVISFDDGYAGAARYAAPVLARLGLQATVFLTTDFVFLGTRMWWDRLRHLVSAIRRKSVWIETGGRRRNINLGSAEDKVTAIVFLQEHLKRAAPEERACLLAQLAAAAEGNEARVPFPASEPLCAKDLEHLRRIGVSFGSHAISHASLVDLSPADLAYEIEGSRRILQERLGTEAAWFSYPFGFFDSEVAAAVGRAGYRGAVTAIHGLNGAGRDTYHIRRVAVGGHTSFDQFRVLISGLR